MFAVYELYNRILLFWFALMGKAECMGVTVFLRKNIRSLFVVLDTGPSLWRDTPENLELSALLACYLVFLEDSRIVFIFSC